MSGALRALAPGKVNLCLFLGSVREDGRHRLVSLFESLSLADVVVASPSSADEVICPGVSGPNLAAAALSALRARGWDGPPLRIEIAKRVPVAAGMGGGSADAAAVLRLAQEFGRVPGGHPALEAIAASLGADVPAQLRPGVALGTGAGEIVQPLPALGEHAVLIVPARERLSTAVVYREADRLGLGRSDAELSAVEAELRGALGGEHSPVLPTHLQHNDLEPAAFSLCPGIADTLEAVRAAGAVRALVCGSGPTIAGLFWGKGAERRAAEAGEGLDGSALVACPVPAAYGAPTAGHLPGEAQSPSRP